MFGDAIKNGVRLLFTFWIHQLWGVAVVFALAYFMYCMLVEGISSTL